MQIVITSRDMIMVSPNERYTVPDAIGQALIDRGRAEEIKPDILQQEEQAEEPVWIKPEPKHKKGK